MPAALPVPPAAVLRQKNLRVFQGRRRRIFQVFLQFVANKRIRRRQRTFRPAAAARSGKFFTPPITTAARSCGGDDSASQRCVALQCYKHRSCICCGVYIYRIAIARCRLDIRAGVAIKK